MSKGIDKIAVRRSETARDMIKRLVVALRRFELIHVAMSTKVLPIIAATMTIINAIVRKMVNGEEKNRYP